MSHSSGLNSLKCFYVMFDDTFSSHHIGREALFNLIIFAIVLL